MDDRDKSNHLDNNKERKIYSLADMYGKGELISWMKYAANTGDHSFINECIESKVNNNNIMIYIFFFRFLILCIIMVKEKLWQYQN